VPLRAPPGGRRANVGYGRAVAPDDVAEVLATVAAALPHGGEERPGQVQMAEAVARAIESERHLVVQAGTGTGKSLAYLVPAVLSGRRVVVATATKALQDQLAHKDLPAVARALGRPFAYAILKGRSNYLCLQRSAETDGRGVQQDLGTSGSDPVSQADGDADAPDADPDRQPLDAGGLVEQVRRLIEWGRETRTGDRADLPFEPHPRAWAMLSVGPRECPGAARCPQGGPCFAERARADAAKADVVVVNTHLYGSHLASGGALLPSHEVVVFDEAHEVEDVMTESLGIDLSPGRLRALHASARGLVAERELERAGLLDAASELRRLLAARVGRRVFHEALPRRPGRVRPDVPPDTDGRSRPFFGLPGPAPGPRDETVPRAHDGDEELGRAIELATGRVEQLRALLRGAGRPAPASSGDARRLRALVAADHLADDLGRLAGRSDDEVAWVDGTVDAPVLRLSPVAVGPILAAGLWPETTAVLTSATVPPRVEERLGLDGTDVQRLDVASPFDFRTHALLYVARHLPDRRRPASEAALVDEMAALIEAAGGRTLALFTSRRATESAAAALGPRLPFRILVQGSLPKRRLLETFAAEETSCLFATIGFWQGVDVPGRSLSLVTLDRLPFGRPDDPLLEARRERAGAAAFSVVDLPRAATLLAQGVGRLIRSAGDHGVVAVLDPRLATAGYRRVLLDALPPMRRTVTRDEVVDFLGRVLAPDP
jgi:ATP-dependent DNA helicase DinG